MTNIPFIVLREAEKQKAWVRVALLPLEKFYDIDDHMIEEIYESLLEYYGFLSKHKLASVKNFRLFKKDILGIKQELIDKMERYNMIRHDHELDEDEKEAIREEIFAGDHAWPFF